MTAAQASDGGTGGNISSIGAHLLALWLGVLLPVCTVVQLTYLSSHFAKLSQPVIAGIAFLLIGMVTLGLRAALAIWQGRANAAQLSENALIAVMAANMLACAPLSILMSAPPYFLPVVLISLICFSMVDRWKGGGAT